MPRILRAPDLSPATWPGVLGHATTLGFDSMLVPGLDVPATLVEAARGLGVGLMADVAIDQVAASTVGEAASPFCRLAAPSLDPRAPVADADTAVAALGDAADAEGLAAWWVPRLMALREAGVAGVRLLGLSNLPGFAVGPFLRALRDGCPGLLLFGWTPGVAWPVLQGLPPGVVDLVASSLSWWDGQSDWLWRELDMLRRIAPVVAEAGHDPAQEALAACLAEGWMTVPDAAGAEALAAARGGFAGLAWSRLVSPPGGAVTAVLRTDAADPRLARKAALAVTRMRLGVGVAGSIVLSAMEGEFEAFTAAGGAVLHAGATVSAEPGQMAVFAARALGEPARPGLSRKRAEAAGLEARLAIENPSPCVEGGRFPAHLVVGSLVTVEADVIGDGHDKLGVALRWQAPGSEEWGEVRMTLVGNDRWTGAFPLERMGTYRYVVEAWRDAFATFTDELEKKFTAGVPISLELQEGVALVREAEQRGKKARGALGEVVKALDRGDAAAQRETLLSGETRAAMARADDRPHGVSTAAMPVQAERAGAAFASWYEVFPRSLSDDEGRHGTFRDVVRHLPRIEAMGFDVLYFPPIHPIGRKNRKGRNNTLTPAADDPGSPYAIGSEDGGHDALHPELGSLEDFQHLRMKAGEHGIELAIDFAIQCSPDHPWLKEHKDWFMWRPDGTIRYAENPPKKYEDIVNVDFYAPGAVPELWLALANAVLFWASQGVRLFRVDNPHTKPLPFWEWMIAEVQARYPDSVFLAEAFTRPKVMYRLAKVGFSQSYTYFTWRNNKREFEEYLTELSEGPPRDFFRPHFFVNTPDINPVPLQTSPRSGFLTRAALAATLSGLWGVYNGFELCEATPVPGKEEYQDSEKYQLRAWDWERPGNIVAEIAVLNAIRKRNPALHTHLGVTFLEADNDQVLLFEKATADRSNVLLVAINMDLHQAQSSRIAVPFWRWTPQPGSLEAFDLVGGRRERWTEDRRFVSLTSDQPYAIWRLSPIEVSE